MYGLTVVLFGAEGSESPSATVIKTHDKMNRSTQNLVNEAKCVFPGMFLKSRE